MELGLKGKAALVTASSKGIGLGVAKVLASEGCKVAICARSTDSITRAQDQIVGATGDLEVSAYGADVTVKEDVDLLVPTTLGEVGRVATRAARPEPAARRSHEP